jgi:hypothetical protein
MGRDGEVQLLIPLFCREEKGPLQLERPLSHAACRSALLLVVAVLIGTLIALLATLAILLLLLLFATLFLVALLLLMGVLVSHFQSPFRHTIMRVTQIQPRATPDVACRPNGFAGAWRQRDQRHLIAATCAAVIGSFND